MDLALTAPVLVDLQEVDIDLADMEQAAPVLILPDLVGFDDLKVVLEEELVDLGLAPPLFLKISHRRRLLAVMKISGAKQALKIKISRTKSLK